MTEHEIDFGKIPLGQGMTVWVSAARCPCTTLVVSPPTIFSGGFEGIDHPEPGLPPWILLRTPNGTLAGFPLDDVAQIQAH